MWRCVLFDHYGYRILSLRCDASGERGISAVGLRGWGLSCRFTADLMNAPMSSMRYADLGRCCATQISLNRDVIYSLQGWDVQILRPTYSNPVLGLSIMRMNVMNIISDIIDILELPNYPGIYQR